MQGRPVRPGRARLAGKRQRRLVIPHLGLERREFGLGDVRRVGHDDVKTCVLGQRAEKIALEQRDAVFQAVTDDVLAGQLQGVGGQVGCPDPPVRPLHPKGDGQAATAGADVGQHGRGHVLALLQSGFGHSLRFRTRDQHGPVDLERTPVEPGLPGNVREGAALRSQGDGLFVDGLLAPGQRALRVARQVLPRGLQGPGQQQPGVQPGRVHPGGGQHRDGEGEGLGDGHGTPAIASSHTLGAGTPRLRSLDHLPEAEGWRLGRWSGRRNVLAAPFPVKADGDLDPNPCPLPSPPTRSGGAVAKSRVTEQSGGDSPPHFRKSSTTGTVTGGFLTGRRSVTVSAPTSCEACQSGRPSIFSSEASFSSCAYSMRPA